MDLKIGHRHDQMIRRTFRIGALVFAGAMVLVALAAGAAQPGVQLNASVPQSQITLADTLEYRIELTGVMGGQGAQPQPPDFQSAGFQVVGGPSVEQRFNLSPGIQSSSVAYRWALRPLREGTLEIPPARVTLPNGQALASNSIRVTVSKVAAPPPAVSSSFQGEEILPARTGNDAVDRQLSGRLFLRPIIDKTEAFVGEQVTLRFELYQAETLPVVGYGFESRPTYPGFLVEALYQPPRGQLEFQRQTVNGVAYRVATIEAVALFANRTGTVTIPAMVMTVDLPVQQQGRRRPRSPFDDSFFDDLFSDPFGPPTIPARVMTRAIEVKILPLPAENRPTSFSNTVGEFQITAAFDRPQVRQYDVVDLKVQFSGKGKVDAISPPPLPRMNELQLYKEQSSNEMSHAGGLVGGTKTFEFFLRPTVAGDIKFPGLSYTIFNPREKRYVELKTEPLALNVLPAPKSDQPVVISFPTTPGGPGGPAASPVVELNRNIEYIRTTGFLSHGLTAAPLYDSLAFLLFQAVPIALVAVSYGVRRRREKLEGDVAWARRRSARSVASKRLRGAAKLLTPEHGDRFFEELDRALRQFVADQLNESAAGLTADRIAQTLSGRGIETADVDELLALLELCESARYAVSRPDAAEMRGAFERASELIDRLAKNLRT